MQNLTILVLSDKQLYVELNYNYFIMSGKGIKKSCLVTIFKMFGVAMEVSVKYTICAIIVIIVVPFTLACVSMRF